MVAGKYCRRSVCLHLRICVLMLVLLLAFMVVAGVFDRVRIVCMCLGFLPIRFNACTVVASEQLNAHTYYIKKNIGSSGLYVYS